MEPGPATPLILANGSPVSDANPFPVKGMSGGTGGASELHLGEVGGYSPRVTATFTRPADNTAYQAGDIIANSLTASLVVPLTFQAARVSGGSGRLTGCRAVVAPASGNLVIANLAFDLLVFRAAADTPFAAAGYPADNAQMTVTAAALRELVAVFPFPAAGWRSGLGSVTAAGAAGWQAVLLSSGRNYAPFNLASIPSQNLVGVVQAQAAWAPTGVANTFDFALDVEGN
jgi:hypothetical protein